ncbi:hypothetical protein AOLI_G00250170 [Acnodon oligacanthus]
MIFSGIVDSRSQSAGRSNTATSSGEEVDRGIERRGLIGPSCRAFVAGWSPASCSERLEVPLVIEAQRSDKERPWEECSKFKGKLVDLHWYQAHNRLVKDFEASTRGAVNGRHTVN